METPPLGESNGTCLTLLHKSQGVGLSVRTFQLIFIKHRVHFVSPVSIPKSEVVPMLSSHLPSVHDTRRFHIDPCGPNTSGLGGT